MKQEEISIWFKRLCNKALRIAEAKRKILSAFSGTDFGMTQINDETVTIEIRFGHPNTQSWTKSIVLTKELIEMNDPDFDAYIANIERIAAEYDEAMA